MDLDGGLIRPAGAASGREMAAFLDPGLDFSTDELSPVEATNYLAWCARVHGENNLDLVPFAQFFVECDPAGLKYLRRHTAEIGLPISPAVLMWAHTYCLLGSAKGTLYEVIAARQLGASRQDIVELLRCAGYFGGPYALNAAAELTLPYLRSWPEGEPSTLSWPAGWHSNPDALLSGISHKSSALGPEELGLIENWYERVYGEVPAELRLMAKSQPGAFKMARVRFERLAMTALPVELLPLLMLHHSTIMRQARSSRRAVKLAIALGIETELLLKTVLWASVMGGLDAAEEVCSSVYELLESSEGIA